jgi:hypothetical protein
MKKGGLTAEAVEAKLLELHGNLAAVGRHFGVKRQSVWGFVNSRPSLRAVATSIREAMKDNAESALYTAVLKGEAWAVCFYLKTQAKDRGYVERAELAADLAVRQRVVEEVVDVADVHRNGDTPR